MPLDPIILEQIKANNHLLTELDLSEENLDEKDVSSLIEAINHNDSLCSLNMARIRLQDKHVIDIF